MLVIDFDQAVKSVTFLERNPIFYQGRPLRGNAPGAFGQTTVTVVTNCKFAQKKLAFRRIWPTLKSTT